MVGSQSSRRPAWWHVHQEQSLVLNSYPSVSLRSNSPRPFDILEGWEWLALHPQPSSNGAIVFLVPAGRNEQWCHSLSHRLAGLLQLGHLTLSSLLIDPFPGSGLDVRPSEWQENVAPHLKRFLPTECQQHPRLDPGHLKIGHLGLTP